MADAEALIFRASLEPKIYRDIEVVETSTLYALAKAIVAKAPVQYPSFDDDDEASV